MNSSDLAFDSDAPPLVNSSGYLQSQDNQNVMNCEEINNNGKRKEVKKKEEGPSVSKKARIRGTMPHQITIFRFSLPDPDDYVFESEDKINESDDEADVEIDESEDEEVDVEMDEPEGEVEPEIQESEDDFGQYLHYIEDDSEIKIDW